MKKHSYFSLCIKAHSIFNIDINNKKNLNVTKRSNKKKSSLHKLSLIEISMSHAPRVIKEPFDVLLCKIIN
jgi:hypothetical protein